MAMKYERDGLYFVPEYPVRSAKETADMKPDQKAAYWDWRHEFIRRLGRIPNDLGVLQHAAKIPKQRARKIRDAFLESGIYEIDSQGMLIHPLTSDCISEAIAKHKQAVEKGSKGGKTTAENRKEREIFQDRPAAGSEAEATATKSITKTKTRTKNGLSLENEKDCPISFEESIPDSFPDPASIKQADRVFGGRNRGDLSAKRVAQEFRDHALSNGRTSKNWPAAWRTWYGRAPETKPRSPDYNPTITTYADEGHWTRRLDGLKDNGLWSSGWGALPTEAECQVPIALLTEFEEWATENKFDPSEI